MNILIVGPIGSGKTTQAKILSRELDFQLIKAGALLRIEMEKHASNSRSIKKAVSSGKMVKNKVVASMVKKAMDGGENFIFDGYPRRLSQLRIFNPKIDRVIYLKISDAQVRRRLEKRKRADDKPDIIKERLRLYHLEINPLLEYYRGLSRLVVLSGLGTQTEVKNRIRKVI